MGMGDGGVEDWARGDRRLGEGSFSACWSTGLGDFPPWSLEVEFTSSRRGTLHVGEGSKMVLRLIVFVEPSPFVGSSVGVGRRSVRVTRSSSRVR